MQLISMTTVSKILCTILLAQRVAGISKHCAQRFSILELLTPDLSIIYDEDKLTCAANYWELHSGSSGDCVTATGCKITVDPANKLNYKVVVTGKYPATLDISRKTNNCASSTVTGGAANVFPASKGCGGKNQETWEITRYFISCQSGAGANQMCPPLSLPK